MDNKVEVIGIDHGWSGMKTVHEVYGAELFEQYQRKHGAEQMAEAAGRAVTQEVQKSR